MAGTGAACAPRTNFEPYRHPGAMNQSSNLLTRRNAAMPVAQPATLEVTAAIPSASERLVDQLANRIGGLGVELADVAGNLQEGAGRGTRPFERFGRLQKTAETMVSANRVIATASQAVQSATSAAVGEI